ncbi:hypothetical protein QUF72_19975 [Desulfobacterales bacterium HSG2]|nr:hypothetical protein [Desulfobacterales bacterium HSG2]
MNRFLIVFTLAAALIFSTVASASPQKDPLALLIQPKGTVMYSPDGERWKNVRRNRFLFEGWHVKTGSDGFCKLLNQETGMIESVESNTRVEIRTGGANVVRGTISEPKPAANFMSLLKRKFAKVQKYSAVKRHHKERAETELKTVREITLSRDYPDLVWENPGPKYSYRLVVGEEVFDVPGTRGDMIRFKLSRTNPGLSDYHVQVIRDGEVAYTPEEKGRIRWLSQSEMKSFREKAERIRQTDPDGFLLGSFMDDHGFKIPAMDQYRKFLSQNPDANEMRPFLIKVLGDLKLETLKQAELAVYHARTE